MGQWKAGRWRADKWAGALAGGAILSINFAAAHAHTCTCSDVLLCRMMLSPCILV